MSKEKLVKIVIEDNGSVLLVGKSETPEQKWNFCGMSSFCRLVGTMFDEIEDWKENNKKGE